MSAPGGSNFQPESVAELSRFVQYMFDGVNKELSHITTKLDRLDVVTKDQHRDDLDELKEQIRELKQDREEDQAKLSSYGRWFVSSLILPLAGLIVTIYGLLNGGS